MDDMIKFFTTVGGIIVTLATILAIIATAEDVRKLWGKERDKDESHHD